MYVYMVRCEDGSLYTGIAKDIVCRLREHLFRTKTCAKYTRSHQVAALVCLWTAEDKSAAGKLEYRIKQLKRCEKDELIAKPETLTDFFGDTAGFSFVDRAEQQALWEKALSAD